MPREKRTARMSTGAPRNVKLSAKFELDGYPILLGITKVTQSSWYIEGFGAFKYYCGMLRDNGQRTLIENGIKTKTLRLDYYSSPGGETNDRFLVLCVPSLDEQGAIPKIYYYGIPEKQKSTKKDVQMLAANFEDMFRECEFQLEKHYQLDIGILDLPFAGKGELRDVGTYRIFYDGESKQLFAFNEEFGIGVEKENLQLINEIFKPYYRVTIVVKDPPGRKMAVGNGGLGFLLDRLSCETKIRAIHKYNVLTERKKAMVLLASPELGQDTSDSFESESDISAASAISIDVFAYDKFDIIPVVSINIATRNSSQGMLLRDGDTLFFRRTDGQWYYRELLASIYYREEAAIVVGLLDHELPEISIYEASIGIPASTGSIGQATGTATKEYILREVSINVGLMLDERYSFECEEMRASAETKRHLTDITNF